MGVFKRGQYWYIEFTFKEKRIKKSAGPSRQGAEKIIAKIKGEIAENKFLDQRHEPSAIKFYNFAMEYLQWSKTNKTFSSWRNDLYCMRMLDKEFGEKNLSDITTWQIEKWKSKRKEDQSRRKKPIGPYEVNRELALLKSLFTKAIEWGKLKENPAKKVKLLKGEVKRVRFLLPDQINILFSNCSDHLRPIVIIAVNTGMRKMEILRLEWDRLDFDRGIITILDTKNNERPDIPMNDLVKETLMGLERKGKYVFLNYNRKPFMNIRKSFDTALKKSGITDFHFHDLRHTFASNLIMAGEDPSTIADLLGHKSLEMTRRYSHLSPKFKKDAVKVLDRILSPEQNPHQSKDKRRVVPIRGRND